MSSSILPNSFHNNKDIILGALCYEHRLLDTIISIPKKLSKYLLPSISDMVRREFEQNRSSTANYMPIVFMHTLWLASCQLTCVNNENDEFKKFWTTGPHWHCYNRILIFTPGPHSDNPLASSSHIFTLLPLIF